MQRTKYSKYEYHINLDERGEFFADVRNASTGKSVFEIHGFDIFEEGFMRNKHDVSSLHEYLTDLQILSSSSELVEG